MAKKNKTQNKDIENNDVQVNETDSDSSEKVQFEGGAETVPSRILSETEAREFVERHYVVPQNNKHVFVSEDRNVFWEHGENAAINYVRSKGIKLFRLTWD